MSNSDKLCKTKNLNLYSKDNNANILRLEMNFIEFPIFTKNKGAKINTSLKYTFNKNSSLEIFPAPNLKLPGQFDEKILFALLELFKLQNYQEIIYFDSNQIFQDLRALRFVEAIFSNFISKGCLDVMIS